MDRRELLTEVFSDTENWIGCTSELKNSVSESINKTKLYMEENIPEAEYEKSFETEISVTASRSFEAAMRLRKEYPDAKIAVHNFASATNPGGGVTHGASAQEECLCRCSTLYPVISNGKVREYYNYHRRKNDLRYSDACIYSPDIVIIKSDENVPQRLDKKDWCRVDVITCAAPNLNPKRYSDGERKIISDTELMELHIKRARAMLSVAAENGAEILVLGAFGCGAFRNNPFVVANAYKRVLSEFAGCFKKIEFAVYCTQRDKSNYEIFKRILG